MKKHLICSVEEDSIANELEIEPGDYLVSINDKEIIDIFDYTYSKKIFFFFSFLIL